MARSGTRPTVIIDLQTDDHPLETLRNLISEDDNGRDIAQIDEKRATPVIFVRSFNQELLERIDLEGRFDGSLRHQSQHENWAVFLQGTGRFSGISGSISGSSTISRLSLQEQRGLSE